MHLKRIKRHVHLGKQSFPKCTCLWFEVGDVIITSKDKVEAVGLKRFF
ncbi:hypothetical protein [Clostridium botulinum]|nr:hypothetical protein [Clostridium botulinum]UZP06021.1 hypothetical protein JYA71_13490 [Clostridium botulinum]